MGTDIDPPDNDTSLIRRVVDRSDLLAWTWRWWERFRDGYGTLSAKGIAFYAFFSLLSGMALAYGVAFTQLGDLQQIITRTLTEAFPGLIGPDGIDPTTFSQQAGTIGIIGAVALLYSALAVLRALDSGVRLIYGVQYDPRGLFVKSARHLGYMLVLVPLLVLSYLGTTVVAGLFGDALVDLGLTGPLAMAALVSSSLTLAVGLNTLVCWIVLSRLTGVQPSARARLAGALLGGVLFEAVKYGSATYIAYVLDDVGYTVFAVPVAFLLLFFVMAATILIAAALTATMSEVDPIMAARRRQAG